MKKHKQIINPFGLNEQKPGKPKNLLYLNNVDKFDSEVWANINKNTFDKNILILRNFKNNLKQGEYYE